MLWLMLLFFSYHSTIYLKVTLKYVRAVNGIYIYIYIIFFSQSAYSVPKVECIIASMRLLQCKTVNSASDLCVNAKLHTACSIWKQTSCVFASQSLLKSFQNLYVRFFFSFINAMLVYASFSNSWSLYSFSHFAVQLF